MEPKISDKDVLRDLALIYVALAHGADLEMDDAEADAIVDRLHLWRSDISDEGVHEVVGEALQAYTSSEATDRIARAVNSIGDAVPEDLRQFILEDLVNIALADDKFLHAENSFIGDLADAWGVHLEDESVEERPWSILEADPEAGQDWSAVHDLALIYVALAHGTDHHLSSEEIEAITEKLGEWLPDAEYEDVLEIVKDALREYAKSPDESLFNEAVASIREIVPQHQRRALLDDLQYVADSDGELLEPEEDLIDRLADAWEMDRTS